jgi:hypothetical protein
MAADLGKKERRAKVAALYKFLLLTSIVCMLLDEDIPLVLCEEVADREGAVRLKRQES